jgi:hypothetical protein
MRGAIQLMTLRTAWYQVVDRMAPVNVRCHVTRPVLPADSAHPKEVTPVSMSVKDWSSTSFTICRSGSATGTSTGSWVTGPCPASFNHKRERRTAFSATSIALEPVWANVLISHRQARAFLIFQRPQPIRARTLVRQEVSSEILARQTVPT